jgi:AcrR family transcriptional regulator
MEKPTKERIMEEALRLFSQRGYDAVSVEQIALAVGIKAPSLYKHYKGKRAIFDAIFAEMQRRYDAEAAAMQLNLENAGADSPMFACMTAETLVEKVTALVTYSLRDEFVSRFRRLMTIEQFHSQELAALYTERYVMRMLHYHETLFRGLIQNGTLRSGDALAMAWQFTAPVFTLLGVCDRQPEQEDWAVEQLRTHILQFYTAYQVEEQK